MSNIEKIKKLLDSITEVYVNLFPNCYEQDRQIYEILKPYVKSVDISGITEKTDHEFSISLFNFLSCIDSSIGLSKWRNNYEKTKIYNNIEDNIRGTLSKMSSIETIYFYKICPNLTNIIFEINITKTTRPVKKVSDIFNPIEDIFPKHFVVRLRNLFNQNIVNDINKYFITKNLLNNNAMVKTNNIEFKNVEQMFSFFSEFVEFSKIENIDKILYGQFELFDNENLTDVKITLVTDFDIE